MFKYLKAKKQKLDLEISLLTKFKDVVDNGAQYLDLLKQFGDIPKDDLQREVVDKVVDNIKKTK